MELGQTDGRDTTPDYGIFLDLENVWIENRKILFPFYDWKGDSFNGSPPDAALRDLISTQLAEFPDVLERVIGERMGIGKPRWKHAAAVWGKLERSPTQNARIEAILAARGYHLERPLSLPPTSSRETAVVKEAADRELTYSLIDAVVFRRALGLRAAVLVTGDHFGARLIHFLREHSDVEIFVASFRNALSSTLRHSADERLIIIDESEHYRAYRERTDELAGATRHIPPSIKDAMLYTAIYKLHRTGLPYVAPAEFQKWISGWIAHFQASGSTLDLETDPRAHLAQLIDAGVLKIDRQKRTDRGAKESVELVHDHPLVASAIDAISKNPQVFIVTWGVPTAT